MPTPTAGIGMTANIIISPHLYPCPHAWLSFFDTRQFKAFLQGLKAVLGGLGNNATEIKSTKTLFAEAGFDCLPGGALIAPWLPRLLTMSWAITLAVTAVSPSCCQKS